jgi:hypothetical protein
MGGQLLQVIGNPINGILMPRLGIATSLLQLRNNLAGPIGVFFDPGNLCRMVLSARLGSAEALHLYGIPLQLIRRYLCILICGRGEFTKCVSLVGLVHSGAC